MTENESIETYAYFSTEYNNYTIDIMTMNRDEVEIILDFLYIEHSRFPNNKFVIMITKPRTGKKIIFNFMTNMYKEVGGEWKKNENIHNFIRNIILDK